MSKKVLIISYYYPPENSISSRRPLAFAKAFQQAGYDVTVLTRHRDINNFQTYLDLNAPSYKSNSTQKEDEIKTIRIGFKHIKPLSFLLKYGFSFTDALFVLRSFFNKGINIELDVFHNFYSFLSGHLKKEKYDIVLVSIFPLNLMRVLSRFKKRIPFTIVDIRDYFNNYIFHDNYNPSLSQRIQNRLFERDMERWLNGISLIDAVNDPILQRVGQFNKSDQLKILNGFEEQICISLRKQPFPEFTITTLGALYFQQKLDIMLEGFGKFLDKKKDVKILFLGLKMFPEVAGYVSKNLDYPQVLVTDRVPREEALQKAYNSHVLFYSGWQGYRGIYSGKIFEYLGLRKNILICPKDNDVIDQLIENTNAGVCVNSSEEMASILNKWYEEWKRTGEVSYYGIEKNIMEFTRENQSRKLVDEVNALV